MTPYSVPWNRQRRRVHRAILRNPLLVTARSESADREPIPDDWPGASLIEAIGTWTEAIELVIRAHQTELNQQAAAQPAPLRH